MEPEVKGINLLLSSFRLGFVMIMGINSKTVSMPHMLGLGMGAYSAQPIAPKLAAKAPGPPQDVLLNPDAPVWTEIQSRALVSLARAVDDSSVFVALVGPAKSGTSNLLAKLLAQSKTGSRICISIQYPNRISANDVAEIDRAVVEATDGVENRSVHLLIGVHDAHAASAELLGMLDRFAQSRDRVLTPQVILAGEPELWDHLAAPRHEILRRRLALRLTLPPILTV